MTSYTFAALAIVMFFMRRYMVRRMEKHVAYLAEQKEKEAAQEK
jgi:hypothetical protein